MNCVKSNTLAQSNTVVMSSPVVHLLPIVALLVAVSAQGFNSPPNVNLPTQEGLTRLFFNARDPQTALACFAGYIGESNLITANYSEEYSRCLTDAQDSRRSLDSRFLPTRNKIDQTVVSVCSALSDCIKVNSTLGSFNCHANAGSNNTVAIYNISSNAADSAQVLRESYRLIDLHHEQCNQKAKRTYVETTTSNYNYLQACLEGRTKPKPAITSTTTTTTETPTTTVTESSTTTTIESSTSPNVTSTLDY